MKHWERRHLAWLRRHHPAATLRLEQAGKLEEELAQFRLRAVSALRSLKGEGLTNRQIYRAVREHVLDLMT